LPSGDRSAAGEDRYHDTFAASKTLAYMGVVPAIIHGGNDFASEVREGRAIAQDVSFSDFNHDTLMQDGAVYVAARPWIPPADNLCSRT
jgi:hypothetical protein